MNKIPYEVRSQVYVNALIANGEKYQMAVHIEELSECIKEICKALRGKVNEDHLAEEVADATIVLEQMRLLFNINDRVCEYMDAKVLRLDEKLKEGKHC